MSKKNRKRLFTDTVSGYKKYVTDTVSGYKKYLTDTVSGYKKFVTYTLSGYKKYITDTVFVNKSTSQIHLISFPKRDGVICREGSGK